MEGSGESEGEWLYSWGVFGWRDKHKRKV